MALIRDRRVVTDDAWTTIADDTPVPETGDVIVSLTRWLAQSPSLSATGRRIGVRLQPDDDVEQIAATLGAIALVEVDFPKFTDGRGYSTARLLRDRLGFAGEVRATGHVLPDQVFYMARCGFDAFELADGKSPDDALAALEAFSVTYQAAADDPRPLFRRRHAS
jgi:uncharacterized protein (DUF934 family)